jgi:KDEL-tailed cysteine endopeptidase
MFRFAFALAITEAAAHPSFEEWAAQYGITNGDDTMKAKYNANLAEIDALNAADNGATFAVNQFSGMTFEEFASAMLTDTDPDSHNVDPTKVSVNYLEEQADLAASIDWVKKGGVTPVKDQGQCGSCWAFSTMAAVEAVHKINSGSTVNLAEQQLVDCDTSGQSGCSGGSATSALQWLKSNPACTTASYPYKATNGNCQSCSSAGVTVGGVNLVTSRSESALASALNGSPASVSVNAGSSWQHYSSGILQDSTTCSHNHAVLAVGYTEDAWKIKNSWGKSFGESGYIRIAKGLGGCGASGIVTSQARIPTGVNVESVAV